MRDDFVACHLARVVGDPLQKVIEHRFCCAEDRFAHGTDQLVLRGPPPQEHVHTLRAKREHARNHTNVHATDAESPRCACVGVPPG